MEFTQEQYLQLKVNYTFNYMSFRRIMLDRVISKLSLPDKKHERDIFYYIGYHCFPFHAIIYREPKELNES
jgi:hypothetical protein